ncbi:peptidase T [Finegoldia magna]|uniref:peptidase T n=1 Tax=Finegoldia magna TaxID=1260 RepID=UPI002914D6F1|nr:peptidase T [Finegoldia magna]MDU5201354.1 peptidase T [Finegoldia magna]MDU6776274.1 peptidase T [Finegoldia magna]
MIDIVDRFIEYAKIYTTSDESSETCPSTARQKDLGNLLVKQLKEMGIDNAHMDENGYVYASLESNLDRESKSIGFISHMDTAPDMSGENVKPQILEYKGGDIKLSDSVTTTVEDFPFLKDLEGQALIHTDGTTLLGADDKSGIAIIMDAVNKLCENKNIKHPTIKIGFTPDEEIGRGADLFDVEKFGADFAYTVDGGPIGELEYENFNAAGATITIHGKNVHPGSAKNTMINSQLIGMELFNELPVAQRPEYTEHYEGFYLLTSFEGTVENTVMKFIIRDHDKKKFEEKKSYLKKLVEFLNVKYNNAIELDMKDSYYNMKEKIEPVMEIVDLAYKSMEDLGIKPLVQPIRGGTDGAQLSYKGLPCPNIFTGGYAFHGKHELLSIDQMKKASDLVLKIIENYSK